MHIDKFNADNCYYNDKNDTMLSLKSPVGLLKGFISRTDKKETK